MLAQSCPEGRLSGAPVAYQAPTIRPAPPLRAEHLDDARLYANRIDMISTLPIKRGGIIVEVGVGHGTFSEVLLDRLQPYEFHAIDLFRMHEIPDHWGVPVEIALRGKTHREFYQDRFAGRQVEPQLSEGNSHEMLSCLPDAYCDAIYLDAMHDYASVMRDVEAALAKTKPDGILIFNDYTFFDPYQGAPYGVVQAVNELVTTTDWKIIGFSLCASMFCDIALRRHRTSST